MKIGILTFHDVYNPGAFLQAYSTIKTLQSLGYDPHIINYTSPKHRFRPWRKLLRYPQILFLNPSGWIESFKRNAAFVKVQSHLLPTSRFEGHDELNNETFDAVIVGADIVWNYESPFWGDDPVYFGYYLKCKKLIAYAASCGPLDLTISAPNFVMEGLKKFDKISVRDIKTAKFVQNAIGKEPPVVMDPTFDLDISNIPMGADAPEEKYFLVYAVPDLLSNEAVKKICEYAKINKLKIVATCYRQAWADNNIIDSGPFDWVNLIRHASYIFTNTFHGTIFSIKLKKKFVLEYNKVIESKTYPVIKNLGLQGHIFTPSCNLSSIFNCQDYEQSIMDIIKSYAVKNREFLINSLAF